MNKPSACIVELLKCLAQLVLLPFAPYGEDRIDAFRLYRDWLTPFDQMVERQKPTSLLNQLARAARRQEKQKAIALPRYRAQQRLWQNMNYCYARFAEKIFSQIVVLYAVTEFDAVLRELWPHGHHVVVSSVLAFMQHVDAFWNWVYHLLAGPNAP